MKKTILLLSSIFLFMHPVHAQISVTEILQLIEQNNTTLRAAFDLTEASKQKTLLDTQLDNPELGFNYLWGNPKQIGRRRDVEISQSFDLSTILGYRRRLAQSQQELLDLEFQQQRLMLRQEALCLLTEITHSNRVVALYDECLAQHRQLLSAYERRFAAGDASKLDVSRIRLLLAEAESDADQSRTERDLQLHELQTLCGGTTIDYDYTDYALLNLAPDVTLLQLQQAQNAQQQAIAEADLKATRAQQLPSIKAGYMAELTDEDQWRGITMGLSIPLWSNRQQLRHARLQQQSARSEAADALFQLEQAIEAQRIRTERNHATALYLRQQIESASTPSLLRKALDEGEISLIDYTTEMTSLFSIQLKLLEAEREYQIASLNYHLMVLPQNK